MKYVEWSDTIYCFKCKNHVEINESDFDGFKSEDGDRSHTYMGYVTCLCGNRIGVDFSTLKWYAHDLTDRLKIKFEGAIRCDCGKVLPKTRGCGCCNKYNV